MMCVYTVWQIQQAWDSCMLAMLFLPFYKKKLTHIGKNAANL